MKEYSAATVAWYIALYLLSAAEENQGTELNDSLQCYNDFKSYVECTWKENRLSRQFVNMSLYKWVNGDIQLSTRINGSQHKKTKSHIIWKSFMPTSSFSIGSVEKYFFAPNQNMESQVLLKIKNKDTIQKEMLKPIMYVSDDKYYFRWPDDLYKLTPHGEAYCEVKYKKETESWEDSTLGLCKSSWGVISGGLLLRGTKYVARMRVKPWFNDQNWSNWSSEVLLAPRKKVKLSDEAKPQNLRCSNFTCTWEIRLEVKSSVSFSLFYKQNQTDQELEYSPSCLEEVVNIPYVSCHCSIPPTELHLRESSIVTVRPKQGNITLQSCFYIKFAPRNLTLQVRDQGEEYLATWNNETLHSATFRYEVCYGEGNASLIEESSDGEKCLQNKFPELLLILNTDIKPATMYYMKVRMRIDEPNPEHCYNGPWSEWSNFSTWETKTVLDLGLLYVMVPICFILLISSTLYGCKILKRTKEQWKARIPDPSKSIFIKDFLQKESHLKCQYEENYHYEELFDVCKTMTSYKDFKDFTINEINKEDVGSENMEQIDYDDSFGIFQNDDIDSTNLNVVISGYKPFSELIDDQKTVKQKDSQLLQNAYDGPYIFCSSNS